MKFTVLGAKGFVGSHLVKYLARNGFEYFAPERNDPSIFERDLGQVIYCIGLTADFRDRLFDTVNAHVCTLINYLQNTNYTSFLYLSSTRLYQRSTDTSEETQVIVNPLISGDLYNISKLMGESVCLSSPNPNIRVARLSNVYGNEYPPVNFLSTLIEQATTYKKIVLKTSMASEKDYISVDDAVELLTKIALNGTCRLYNVASGHNISNKTLVAFIKDITGCADEVLPDAETVAFPQINIKRISEEFSYCSSSLLNVLTILIENYKQAR
ncbi:MAG: NAD(P)-dependent oxidoreductase [Cyanosarcina radialis HA8281-LM2]|jgi:nucleoside-diphosphate-sugar epimerase|nr:NAD(P)-dependent oxidoreductase [Cyanosarcina radialis HA8281-LM2]